MPRRAAARTALLLLLALGAACAAARAEQVRRDALQAALDGQPLPVALDPAWQEVRLLLAGRGYPLAGKDAEAIGRKEGVVSGLAGIFSRARETSVDPRDGRRTLETGWKDGVRYRAEGWDGGETCRVVLTAIREDTTEHGKDRDAARDVELELELVRRIAPARAAAIEGALPRS